MAFVTGPAESIGALLASSRGGPTLAHRGNGGKTDQGPRPIADQAPTGASSALVPCSSRADPSPTATKRGCGTSRYARPQPAAFRVGRTPIVLDVLAKRNPGAYDAEADTSW